MSYALALLETMLIPEPDEQPTPSATDPLALSPLQPAAAVSPIPASRAATVSKPRDLNASATREDYEEAQAAETAAVAKTARAVEKATKVDEAN